MNMYHKLTEARDFRNIRKINYCGLRLVFRKNNNEALLLSRDKVQSPFITLQTRSLLSLLTPSPHFNYFPCLLGPEKHGGDGFL